ncbi:hypothetical protein [Propionicicella superfundia]|uniref:hypothetical protein n=1 Tax=Propionicicella superfundia TaxID=348582 RepID=UPI00040A3542|nr:hypothetical protein [Propionicicella superfundia]
MTEHVTSEQIADAHAGLLAAPESRLVTAHLASCAECAASGDQVASVSRILAGAPAEIIPPEASAALQAAIAAEAARRAAAAQQQEEEPARSADPLLRRSCTPSR